MADKWIQLQSADGIDNLFPIGKVDLLWTNSSPSSGFTNQTVELDLSSYRFVYGLVAVVNSASTLLYPLLLKVGAGSQYCFVSEGNARSYRTFRPTTTGIVISSASTANFGNSVGTNNNYCIPEYFYGIR